MICNYDVGSKIVFSCVIQKILPRDDSDLINSCLTFHFSFQDAFNKWEESDKEQDGKGVALKSCTQFFTWLREAEEAEEGDEEQMKNMDKFEGMDAPAVKDRKLNLDQ